MSVTVDCTSFIDDGEVVYSGVLVLGNKKTCSINLVVKDDKKYNFFIKFIVKEDKNSKSRFVNKYVFKDNISKNDVLTFELNNFNNPLGTLLDSYNFATDDKNRKYYISFSVNAIENSKTILYTIFRKKDDLESKQ